MVSGEGSVKLLGFGQSSESPSPADELSLNQVQCERTTGHPRDMPKQGASDRMPRVPETGWARRAGSCPHLESLAGTDSEEWGAKGWVLGKVQLWVGGSREGRRDYWSRREGNKGKEGSLRQGEENLKEKQENAGKRPWTLAGMRLTLVLALQIPHQGGAAVTPSPTLPFHLFPDSFIRRLETNYARRC